MRYEENKKKKKKKYSAKFTFPLGTVLVLISRSSRFIQIVSLVASESATYSASVDDSEIVVCFFVFHDMAALHSINTYPPVDFLDSVSPAQSESI